MSQSIDRQLVSNKAIKKAIKCLKSGQYGLSCGYFCVALRGTADRQSYELLANRWKSTFLYAFERHIHFLETNSDVDTVITAFDEAINALPNCEDIHYHKGIFFYKRGRLSEAVSAFLSSLALNPNYNLSHLCLENIKSSSMARWHYIMINDVRRNSAFKEAIAVAVRKGYDSVLDIGSGSGLLSLYCVQSGAHKVFACEVSQMLYHLCRDVFQVNGVDKDITLFNEMSTNIRIPQMIENSVSLVVTEIFDSALFGEHVLTTLQSALRNLLDSNHGIVVPMRAQLYGVLIESDELRNTFSLQRRNFGKIVVSDEVSVCVDFNEFKYSTINLAKVSKKYLSHKFLIIDIDFNDISQIDRVLESDYVLDIVVQCVTDGRLDAIGVWFDLNLIEDIHISSEPPSQLIGWEQAIFPAAAQHVLLQHSNQVSIKFTLNEDYLKLIDIQSMTNNQSISQSLLTCDAIHFTSETIKYLNANHFHDKWLKAIEEVIDCQNIETIIDFTYFPISSIQFIDFNSINNIFVVTEDIKIKESFDQFLKMSNSSVNNNNKLVHLDFDRLVEESVTRDKTLVLVDLIETSGLIRSNVLDKLAFLKVYSHHSLHFLPNKITFKALLIQSNDLIIRSRLVSDDNVHGFKIKDLLNVFETEILQDIDYNKLEFTNLSNNFDLLEMNLQQMFDSSDEINLEPNDNRLVHIMRSGDLDAVLYWYEIHLSQQIVISSLDLGPDWHSTAFVLKQAIPVKQNDLISINCLFTNGFLRIKELKVNS